MWYFLGLFTERANNEARWLAAKLDFQDFIRMVKEGLLEGDPDVMDQEPKDSMMRI